MAVFSVIAILLGILCALKFSQTFASWLLAKGFSAPAWAPVVSYIVLFAIVVILVRLIAKLLQKLTEGLMLGIINKISGGVLYAILALVLWSSLLWLGSKVQIVTPVMIATSKTYTYVSPIAPWFFNIAGSMLPFVKDTFANLEHFFDTVNQKIPTHVGTN